jgi:hypothetical protein
MSKLALQTELEGMYLPSKIWVYNDFLDEETRIYINDYIKHRTNGKWKQNINERRSFVFQGQNIKLCGLATYRAYQILWSLSQNPEYFHQTNDTIADWSEEYLNKNLDPVCRLMIQSARNAAPFNGDKNWIPFRGIINILPAGENLEAHLDADDQVIDTEVSQVHSFTYYANGANGGDFWAHDKYDEEFRYSPNANDALIIQGTGTYHGVSKVKENTRLCMTIRFIHADDLILHGHPDKFLWKPNFE